MSKKAIIELSELMEIMKRHENHIPPIPEINCFYKTYNSSIVYIYNIYSDGEAQAVILRGGFGREDPGSNFILSSDGYHQDKDVVGPHLVMALLEKLHINLPNE